MLIKHTLLNKQRTRKSSSMVQVDLYPLSEELYNELNKIGIIQRVKEVPHLGAIRVPKSLQKSRYDYIFLQLYFHKLIKIKLSSALKFSYNNKINSQEFGKLLEYKENCQSPSIGELIQILIIVYNIGHFYNTFVASRAAVIFANENDRFKKIIIEASDDSRYQRVAEKMLTDANYQRYHLLNSLLVLKRCDQENFSIQLAQEIIYAYLNESELNPKSKLHYVFDVFRSVRNVAYIAYDLQIASTPLTIDLYDSNSLITLFRELLSEYNDNSSTLKLIESMGKLLDDTVYNKETDAICYYMISSNITRKILQKMNEEDVNYYALWENAASVFNISYPQRRDYVQNGILKLTFELKDREHSQCLFSELKHTNGVRAGYYDRNNGRQTLLVSLKRKCNQKVKVAFYVLKIIVRHLRKFPDIDEHHSWYLLTSKFFLFYLMNEKPINIKPIVSSNIGVICTRGKKERICKIENLLSSSIGNQDNVHEIENLRDVLKTDSKNDVCILLPASILVYEKEEKGKKMCEFDGMIFFPNRDSKQVVFLEAKNTAHRPGYGKKCLKDKLDKLQMDYNPTEIEIRGKDAVLFYDI